jgi:hypothetical protein
VLAILLGALLARTLFWDRPLNLPYWFAQTTPLYVAELLKQGTFWQWWGHLFTVYQQTEPQLSALMLPVATLFQVLLGPSLHLPVLVGAFWGLSAVLLGWALGRSATSKLFGLCFAGFIAVSPLQLVWSRTAESRSGERVSLLVLWCSFLAGRRRSAAALLAGVGLGRPVSVLRHHSIPPGSPRVGVRVERRAAEALEDPPAVLPIASLPI